MRALRIAISCLATVASSATVPTAKTLNGSYYGINVPDLDVDIFWGVSFANQKRFEQATPLTETWNGTRNATEPGLTCAGFGTNPREGWPIGEDCLNLNVVRPQGAYEGLDLPVLVWIYGGGWRQGSNRDPEFNTTYMVQTSVDIGHPLVVVSINYRLSGWGFLASKEVQGNGALNVGLRDQRQALRWINENIRGFGGDPNRVMIWGESAGAESVALQVLAYGGDTQGLFRGGIMASGTFFGFGQQNIAVQQEYYQNVTNHTGCADAINTLQCLKEVPFNVINDTFYGQNEGQVFGPVLDGDFFRSYAYVAWQNGWLPNVNLITGCNSDEGMSLGGQTAANTTEQLVVYYEDLLHLNSTLAEHLVNLYPPNAPQPPYSVPNDYPWTEAMAKVGIFCGNQTRRSYGIAGDIEVMAGRRKTAADWASFGGQAYSFRWDTDPTRFPIKYTAGLGPGFAQHGAELSWEFRLPYVSITPYPPLPNITAMRRNSYAMQATWASFAATGSPNHHGLDWVPYWPAYSNGSQNFVFNATLENTLNLHVEEDDFRTQGMDFINTLWPLINS